MNTVIYTMPPTFPGTVVCENTPVPLHNEQRVLEPTP
jgi:hypothetical protein